MNDNPTGDTVRRTLRDALRASLGPVPGLAIIHSSLPDLGPPVTLSRWDVLHALDDAVRAGWTIALPAFTFSFCRGVGFNAARSPSEVGLVANWALVSLPEALRTRCPIYSFVVVGPQAESLIDLKSETMWGRGSLFEYAERVDARVVMLGCTWKHCTLFHRYEELAGVPYRYFKEFTGQADFGDGSTEVNVRMYVRDLDLNPQNDFSAAVERLRERKLIKSVPLWRGTIESSSAAAFADTMGELMKENPLAMTRDSSVIKHMLAVRRRAKEQPAYRVAILGDASMELLTTAFREKYTSLETDRRIETYNVPFGQLRQEILTENSGLRKFNADTAIFTDRLEDLCGQVWTDLEETVLSERVDEYAAMVRQFHEDFGGWSIIHRFVRLERSPDAERNARLSERLTALNIRFGKCLAGLSNLVWIDPGQEAVLAGIPVTDTRLWRVGRFPYGDQFSRHLAQRWCACVLALLGKSVRVIVLDLDNTMWGGVLGEDGLEGVQIGGDYPGNSFYAFQTAIKGLARQGIALAVCSKNDEKPAFDAMDRLPEMVIRSHDLAAHRINWKSKSTNIREICAELNMGVESVLFIDDNPVEREEVRLSLPGIKILDLPDDPAEYVKTLVESPWITSVQLTGEDAIRLKNLHARQLISQERGQSGNMENFLRKLEMKIYLQPMGEENVCRAVQLCQKTNQFNTTTRRYTQRDLESIVSNGGEVVVVGLEDKHSVRENIGIMNLLWHADVPDTGIIDLYLLSCRVLGRGLETALVTWACRHLLQQGRKKVQAEIIETERNQPVRDVYEKSGFTRSKIHGQWTKELAGLPTLPECYAWIDSTESVEKKV